MRLLRACRSRPRLSLTRRADPPDARRRAGPRLRAALAEQLPEQALLPLDGALGLVAAPLGLQGAVAAQRAARLLDPALGFVAQALGAVLVRCRVSHGAILPGPARP